MSNKTNSTVIYGLEKKFEGWETLLDPENLSLIDILNFRRRKNDFSFDKHTEHLTISKFLSYVTKNTLDEKWKKSTSILNEVLKARMGYYIRWASSSFVTKSIWSRAMCRCNHLSGLATRRARNGLLYPDQAKTENVIAFWLEADLEKIELDQKISNAILEKKKTELKQKDVDIKLTRAEFVVEHSVAGNEAHKLLNNQRLNFIDSLNDSIGSPVDYSVDEKDEKDGDHTERDEIEPSSMPVEESTGSRKVHNNFKRKLDNQTDYVDEGLTLLFDETNEEALMESIDEKTLNIEDKLPLTREDSQSQCMCDDMVEAFQKYQGKIPKTRRAFTPAYWGVLDLTKESLYGCKEFTDDDLKQLSQDFANHIKWKCEPVKKNVQDYFDSNCEEVNSDEKLRKLDRHIQFMKINMNSFQGMLPEEQLKMTSSFPLFHGVFNSSHIKDIWGETQALSTNDARNEKANPFKKARMGRKVDMKATLIKTSNKFEVIYGEVARGLGPLGIPMACPKKRFLDKVKLMVIMRDSINRLLNEMMYVSEETRKSLIVYGWLQVGLELNFYAMDWSGIPADGGDCFMLEDAYCILKSLENKSLETETTVRKLFSENTRGKRRLIAPETKADLNKNRTPQYM
ncbi:13174_t:CDS:10 [Funneliformis geosporum]|nr:13174_t:CDS:10 [Funneliformis geosporum]